MSKGGTCVRVESARSDRVPVCSGVISRFSGIAEREAMEVLDARRERDRVMRAFPRVRMSMRETSGRSSGWGGGVAFATLNALGPREGTSGVAAHKGATGQSAGRLDW